VPAGETWIGVPARRMEGRWDSKEPEHFTTPVLQVAEAGDEKRTEARDGNSGPILEVTMLPDRLDPHTKQQASYSEGMQMWRCICGKALAERPAVGRACKSCGAVVCAVVT